MFRLTLLFASASVFGQTMANDYSCPDQGSVPVDLGSIATLQNAPELCTLTTVNALGDLVPVARSYLEQDWEVSPGPFATALSFSCSEGTCSVNIVDDDMPRDRQFKLTSYSTYLDSSDTNDRKSIVARFLEQATFGPTQDAIENWDYTNFETSFKQWVEDQIDPSVSGLSSHREFFRERLNPRMDQVYPSGKGGPNPCEKNSRWRKFAFTTKDTVRGKKFSATSINGDGTAPFILMIDGYPRTIVSNVDLEDKDGKKLALDTEYDVCHPRNDFWKESFGENFKVRVNGVCYNLKDGNPMVDITGIEGKSLVDITGFDGTLNVLDLTGADIASIDDTVYESDYWTAYQAMDEYILRTAFSSSTCEALPKPFSEDGNPIAPIFGKIRSGTETEYLIFDPRLVFVDNTLEKPAPDGGGQAVIDTDGQMKCANAPRTFINEDHCFLSFDESACSAEAPVVNSITLDAAFLKEVDNLSGRYAFAFQNLPLNGDIKSYDRWRRPQYYIGRLACHWYASVWSRFKSVDEAFCTGQYSTVHPDTEALFARLLNPEYDDPHNPDPKLKDVLRRNTNNCNIGDRNIIDLGFIKSENGTCWKHVHPLEGNIYDMTEWFENSDTEENWVDISQWAGEDEAVLTLPEGYGNEWIYDVVHYHRYLYPPVGKLDDVIQFKDLPNKLETPAVEARFGEIATNSAGQGVVICGSVGEVANKPELGSNFELSEKWGFDDTKDTSTMMGTQKHTVWTLMALKANDQLRQRVAFALSQILVIAPGDLGDHTNTEATLQYYDIFVRNAFGSYRDILKQVAFSEKMARMLSSVRNKSYQYNLRWRVSYPDENFAREIMQLFSIGLHKLNMDGTPVLVDGQPVETYGNDDLMSYSRAWTGLDWQNWRGNNDARSSRVDPMRLIGEWHDYFPKSDLMGGYIGDRNYPLCIDIPEKHFLRKGATYRLLGSRNRPEQLYEPWTWEKDPLIKRLELETSSPLYDKLCAPEGGTCTFPGKIVLDENLLYDDIAKEGVEYSVDTLRTVKVQSGSDAIYYEYVRPPCVEQTFFMGGRKVEDFYRGRWPNTIAWKSMCADPRRDVAAESCCKSGWETSTRYWDHGYKYCHYNGERMSYDSAVDRCAANGKEQCSARVFSSTVAGICAQDIWWGTYYSWTERSCTLKVKVSDTREIAVVHDVDPDYAGETRVWGGVDETTQNFFKPAWIDKLPVGANCSAIPSCIENDDGCFCDTTLTEQIAFASAPSSKEEIVDKCFIGGPNPSSFDSGVYSALDCGVSGVTVYTRGGDCSSLDADTIFQYEDEFGIDRFLKNLVSTVHIDNYSFRNPVQFMSFVDPELRDAHYEIDAVLDSYFYHPNHPPFLANLMIQRFGISNPSPRFTRVVAEAYKSGSYKGIGSGNYGDLGAMVAAILLEPESTSVALTSDPTYGQFREPLIKIISFMRAMGYHHDSPLALPLLNDLQRDVGQGSYQQPSVFSFFLPEFQPTGTIDSAGLVAPEAQILSGKKITELLDGLMRMVKTGLDPCDGGFQSYYPMWKCSRVDGDTSMSYGSLQYSNEDGSIEEVIDELATLLTAGRLSSSKRELIKIATIDQFTYGDREKAIRAMIQLVVTCPEFHGTNLASNSATVRERVVDPVKTERPYKAVIFFMFYGGMDSYNLLVPKCDAMYRQYLEVRGPQLALSQRELLSIGASGTGQPCDTFGVNSKFPFARELYNSGEALFFANTGVLEAPVDKTNYTSTNTRLFAHNHQQKEVMKMDINKEFRNTGVGGRLLDTLKRNGYKTSANSVDSQAILVTGSPVDNNPVRMVTSWYSRDFNRYPTFDHITDRVIQLNGESDRSSNSVFGETWSERLIQSFHENEEMINISRSKEFEVNRFSRHESWLDRRFRAVAQFIKARGSRNVDRDVFVLGEGGFDMHHGNFLERKLVYIDRTLRAFKKEMEAQGLWDDVVIVTGSDFGRTLVPNANYGTDHAWGGNYIMLGGGLNGGKILGKYPSDLTEDSPYRLGKRGRMVPTTSWNSMWNGVAQWMGVTDEDELDAILPNRKNFNACDMYTDQDLFKDGAIPSYC